VEEAAGPQPAANAASQTNASEIVRSTRAV
jgi:hypothetical protein